MVDVADLKSAAVRRAGSSPAIGILIIMILLLLLAVVAEWLLR